MEGRFPSFACPLFSISIISACTVFYKIIMHNCTGKDYSALYGLIDVFFSSEIDTVLTERLREYKRYNKKWRDLFGFFLFMYVIQLCFICHPSDSIVSGGCRDRTQGCCDFGTDS